MPFVYHVDASLLDTEFRGAWEETAGPLPDTWLVTQGWRSRAVQAALYAHYQAGGPLAAPPGLSPHEWGLAVDVALLRADGSVSWDLGDAAWGRLFQAVDASALLHSGRHFTKPDPDHIERVGWQRYKLLQGAGK